MEEHEAGLSFPFERHKCFQTESRPFKPSGCGSVLQMRRT